MTGLPPQAGQRPTTERAGAGGHRRPRSDLHRCLRDATKALHHRLDHHPLLSALVRPGLTIDRYGDALQALQGVFAGAEPAIEDFLAVRPGLFDYRSRRKLPALQADLAALGRDPAPRALRCPAPASVADLIGLLYTVEGTSLGAYHIRRHLCRQGWDGRLPMRFLTADPDRTDGAWAEFLSFADRACAPGDPARAAQMAAAIFPAAIRHLDGSLPPSSGDRDRTVSS
ncbi:MAG: biliverdin-producing heme oxygenase [Telmatospirillum sp.]|nr:biliverdin-producing heme oxygenase [Telmatospirillum sp.]